MSLKGFHVLFITASVLLAVGFGVWALRRPDGGYHAAGVGAFVVAAGLIAYETWFLRKSRRLP